MRKTIISLLFAVSGVAGLAHADTLAMKDNAPDRYVVVKGDTLWAISGHFLKQPWRWPEIWRMNKDEIKNPHWIYPGDVVLLDRTGGTPRLRLLKDGSGGGRNEVKLSPSGRISPLDNNAVPSIPLLAIRPFLNKPLVIEENELLNAPRVAAGPDERVVFAVGDRVYAVNLQGKEGDVWQAYRPGAPLIDPDDPEHKRVIGHQVDYLGDLRLDKNGDVATLRVLSSKEEIGVGARLVRATEETYMNYAPHAPAQQVRGKVVSAYGGVADAGPYTTLVINRGSADGLDVGSVLVTWKSGRPIKKEDKNEPDRFTPPEQSGNLFVYRVFPHFSYGLLLDSTLPVNTADEVTSP
ncbi:LysM peptidoglycan-binding domain-containing protein [Amantichitinum ursilacus]|nr:LysM peptidoglycan-binding domain-containing protein [Amantichitinum ursilacus]